MLCFGFDPHRRRAGVKISDIDRCRSGAAPEQKTGPAGPFYTLPASGRPQGWPTVTVTLPACASWHTSERGPKLQCEGVAGTPSTLTLRLRG